MSCAEYQHDGQQYLSGVLIAPPTRPAIPPERTVGSTPGATDSLTKLMLLQTCAGSSALSDEQLLTLVALSARRQSPMSIGSTLLRTHDRLVGLAGRDVTELVQAGLASESANRIAAAFELGRRVARSRRQDRPTLKTPEDIVAAIGTSMAGLPHEELWCLPLDCHSRLIAEPRVVSKGDVDGTDAGPRSFFRHALASGATSVVIVHNHPSGDPTPSMADRLATRRIAHAGQMIDIPVADHIVIGDGGRYVSLRRTEPHLFRAGP